MGNSFSLCTSPWSSGTFSQSCRYPQVPDSRQFLSAVSQEVFGVRWLYRSRWKERGYLQGTAEVWWERRQRCPLYFLPKILEAAECLMLAGEMIQRPAVGRQSWLQGDITDTGATGWLPLELDQRANWVWTHAQSFLRPEWASRLVCSLSLSAVPGADRSFHRRQQTGNHGNEIILQTVLKEGDAALPTPPPQSTKWNREVKVCALKSVFPTRFLAPDKRQKPCVSLHTPLAPADPAGCTARASPPARTCVCRRRGWHQSY